MDVLPNCTVKTPHDMVQRNGLWWTEVHCGNCGRASGRWVVEQTFSFYLCDDCYAKHGVPAGCMAVPDEVFWAQVNQEQIEQYGRVLSGPELVEVLKDGESTLSKLARDRDRNYP